MTIREHIRTKVFIPRVKEHGMLVIYDPERRYREIVMEMENEHCRVIDAEKSIIEARELAEEGLLDLAAGTIHLLVVRVPAEPPRDEYGKQRDPFSVFAAAGARFPDGPRDDFIELCRSAKRDHIPEVNRMFDQGTPTFEMVDNVDDGGSWPRLKALLFVNSPKEILIGLLSPRESQETKLAADTSWPAEARDFAVRCLGHKLKTKGQTRQSIADELWRVLLFSEFAFDTGGGLPDSLNTIPRAGDEAQGLVYEICEDLRRHDDHKDLYKEVAAKFEAAIELPARIGEVPHLGCRDTFSCEERVFLRRLIDYAVAGKVDLAKDIWTARQRSIWLSQGNRLAEWTLAARALELLEAADAQPVPKFESLESIIHHYAATWRDLDRHHREMEQAANQIQNEHDGLDELLHLARKVYFRSTGELHAEFIRLVGAEGWPAAGGPILWNRQIFPKVVAPLLEAGGRVAWFLVDSLRYELGVELEKQLSDSLKVTIQPVCAQLPTYTEIGMASLMPDAESELSLMEKDGKLVTTLGGTPATTPTARFAWLQARKGDLCGDMDLDDLVRKKKPAVAEKVKLLVIRTRDIDAIAHDSPHQVLEVIPALIRQIFRGIARAAELGFTSAVIATDHGFLLFHEQEAGNVAPRPQGHWLVEKSRCMLGKGQGDAHNLLFKTGEVGIPGPAAHFATPKSLVPYSRGQIYYHEGLSLQECVVPCLTVQLESPQSIGRKTHTPRLTLTYRQGKSDRISSRRPVVDIAWPESDLFSEESEREVAVEAVDSKGKTVGLAATGQAVNPATGCVRIRPGAAIAVGLAMDDAFTGNFSVRVLDPATNVLLADLTLKTDYLE